MSRCTEAEAEDEAEAMVRKTTAQINCIHNATWNEQRKNTKKNTIQIIIVIFTRRKKQNTVRQHRKRQKVFTCLVIVQHPVISLCCNTQRIQLFQWIKNTNGIICNNRWCVCVCVVCAVLNQGFFGAV